MRGPALAALLLLLAGACQVERDDRAPGAAVPDTAAPAERLVEVEVYFTRDEQPVAVARLVPAAAPLRGALQALLAGPTPEERARGLWSWFSEDTAGMLRSVNLASDGRATVDFGHLAGVIPGASSSTGSHLLLLELNRTVFQFPQVSEVEYRMEGSCDAFWNWLQRGCDTVGPASDTVPGGQP